ncbi:hypothetical protein ACQKQA_03195 [Pseudomonas sp. NPDC089530]|uniref:hypothetical protein n=1 Tax=Pseudomonas sp. NPDC089530 TaxID=3390651 RepID=UPI003D031395
MSDNPRYGIGLALVLAAGSTMAEDLPAQSILQRFGVTPEQLPAAVPGQAAEPEQDSRFRIDAEQPWVNVTLGEGKQPETTGNISIDNAAAREFERCRQVRRELQRRGEQRYISCDDSVPGQHPAPWSP